MVLQAADLSLTSAAGTAVSAKKTEVMSSHAVDISLAGATPPPYAPLMVQ